MGRWSRLMVAIPQTTDPQVILRHEARAAGLKKYFTGRPCKHGRLL